MKRPVEIVKGRHSWVIVSGGARRLTVGHHPMLTVNSRNLGGTTTPTYSYYFLLTAFSPQNDGHHPKIDSRYILPGCVTYLWKPNTQTGITNNRLTSNKSAAQDKAGQREAE